MNVAQFRRRIADAVESREPLDSPHFARLAAEAGDEAFWKSQLTLDRAIASWRDQPGSVSRPSTITRKVIAAVSVAAAGFGAAWLTRPAEVMAPPVPSETVVAVAAVDMPPESPSFALASRAIEPVVAPIPRQDKRLAEAAVTAERLAYAFQPVGEQVGSVVRLLIDSVPGADVFAL